MLCTIAHSLSHEDVSALQALEHETGKTLLAFSCRAVNPSSLSAEELQKIKELENRLGVALVAVEGQA